MGILEPRTVEAEASSVCFIIKSGGGLIWGYLCLLGVRIGGQNMCAHNTFNIPVICNARVSARFWHVVFMRWIDSLTHSLLFHRLRAMIPMFFIWVIFPLRLAVKEDFSGIRSSTVYPTAHLLDWFSPQRHFYNLWWYNTTYCYNTPEKKKKTWYDYNVTSKKSVFKPTLRQLRRERGHVLVTIMVHVVRQLAMAVDVDVVSIRIPLRSFLVAS